MNRKHVLICGERSFAAQGLRTLLTTMGFDVSTFSRGDVSKQGPFITGPVLQITENPHLNQMFDVVVNYILLQDESVALNARYMEALARFCREHSVRHLIQVSSCSVYKNGVRFVTETAAVEQDPSRKGPYAAIKLAAENWLRDNLDAATKLTLVRPGLILGFGMGGFMGGIGVRLPFAFVLGLGNRRSRIPLVSRASTNKVIARLVEDERGGEQILLADRNSPTRAEYVQACCEVFGAGKRVIWLPVPLWLTVGAIADLTARLFGRGSMGIYSKVRSVCRYQTFDATHSENRTGVSFALVLRQELRGCFENTDQNFALPTIPRPQFGALSSVVFLGLGRIVKQRHIPSLRRFGFDRTITAYDVQKVDAPWAVEVKNVADQPVASTGLTVVATPGPVHAAAIAALQNTRGPILVEKPLCYTRDELNQWVQFSARQARPVSVCHNYRFKPNVRRMIEHLSKYNPGRLHHVSVTFQSPPVAWDPVLWLRNERRARTLLFDYGLHAMDLGCMFGQGEARLLSCDYDLNLKAQTSFIRGHAAFENHTVSFLLRQGPIPRRMRIEYHFQHYSTTLGISPDSFAAHMSNENFDGWLEETWSAFGGTLRKVAARVLPRFDDDSHAYVLAEAALADQNSQLSVQRLQHFYRLLFTIGDRVYGHPVKEQTVPSEASA